MNTTIFLAHAFAIYLIVMGLAMVLRKEVLLSASQAIFANPGLQLMTGVMVLVLGIVLILSHNVWMLGWPVLVTILAWLIFIKGVILLWVPDVSEKYNKFILKCGRVTAFIPWFAIALGVVLALCSFLK